MESVDRLIVIGTSAGGFNGLHWLLAKLPPDLKASVLVVVHMSPNEQALLDILSQHTQLPIRYAKELDPLVQGEILLARPDRHMRVENRKIRIVYGPRENFERPSIDPLFRSAAIEFRENVIAVTLPGDMEDGVLGMEAIKCHGGITLAQDPLEAVSPFMVNNRLDHNYVDYWLPINQLAAKLVSLTNEAVEPSQQNVDWVTTEDQVSKQRSSGIPELSSIAEPSPFGCPECRGVLFEIKQNGPFHFRCHAGHAYSAEMLSKIQERLAEEAMWSATRVFDEKEALHLRLAEQARKSGQLEGYERHRREAGKARQCSARLREMIRLHNI
ncbi:MULTISPECIES: chemotaxis protein CheB [unclassified Pseudomonas]|uniref:chemotaxis protein CheB n=1 Tax=unclassified Pseudomonas TaxID=196821 RepID=UPI00257C6190|nr:MULTISPECIES: chemotaxis protein CheB [unclassified Pseudomonas]